MKKILGKLILFFCGWKVKISISPTCLQGNAVMIAAPHTSNWDFLYAVCGLWVLGVPFRIFIKDTYTKPWFGFFVRGLGGLGINRSQANNVVEHAAGLLQKSKNFILLITPEGTRGYAKEWKKGFFYIAQKANVPIILAAGDYAHKTILIGKIVDTKDKLIKQVCEEIESFYQPQMAKYPALYNPKI